MAKDSTVMSEEAKQAIAEINRKVDFHIRSMAQSLRWWKEKNLQGEKTT